MGPSERETFKTLLLLQLLLIFNQTSHCALGEALQKLFTGILKIEAKFKNDFI